MARKDHPKAARNEQLPPRFYGDGDTIDPMLRDSNAVQKRLDAIERRKAETTDGLGRERDERGSESYRE